ncbi:hypothetical protein [Paenibacillus sp. 7541]|uniref:hypothetical protein n=1 Tax=Paenibacillus sp. 7541 TaxID=2026236 RepID=UPI000BA7B64E|nr:hypothetical protein [Paenibacillus sp. 7541]PAK48119.1 hypothetical protein CHH75_23240 [Paenibacillus sp. 7541]
MAKKKQKKQKEQKEQRFKYEPEIIASDVHVGIMCLLFPYIFLPYSIWKAVSNKHINYRKGLNYKTVSANVIFSFISYLIYGYFFNWILDYSAVVIIICLLLMAVFTGIYMNRSEWYIKLVEKYEQVVLVHGVRKLDEIADLVKQPKLNVKYDLEYLIEYNYFPKGTIIDDVLKLQQDQERAFPINSEAISEQLFDSHSSSQSKSATVACRGCGNTVVLKLGESEQCEYCGLLISTG